MASKQSWVAGLAGTVVMMAAGTAMAHPGHDLPGIAGGIFHPFGGWDHLLAMLAVGLWALQVGGRGMWLIPASFVAAMVGGGLLAGAGVGLPLVESGIMASVLVLGLLVAGAWKLPTGVGMGLVAVFAMFHGYAHVAEMSAGNLPGYLAGFALSTAALHAAGLGLGVMAARCGTQPLVRICGGAMAAWAMLAWVGGMVG